MINEDLIRRCREKATGANIHQIENYIFLYQGWFLDENEIKDLEQRMEQNIITGTWPKLDKI